LNFIKVTEDDYVELLALNESSVPHVNSIGEIDISAFRSQAFCFNKLCDDDGRIGGFVIALRPGETYNSPNYQWFEKEYDSFLYIDRIIVAPAFRRMGMATKLYAELELLATATGIPRLCCEVNIEPPNPESQMLHRRLGFVSVGTQRTENGKKEVDLLIKSL